ncbi:MAG TPA: S41 family peptidase [Tepidisphaeraceae bacterium]|nr:S41 family peptidase [Tepidisphaeraceae bacterium]
MNREKLAWTVSVVLLGLLAFQLPGSMAQRDDDYSFVRTLVDIHRQVAANYVEPVDETKLRESAIEGMLSQLDPFSVYVPPSKQEDFERMLENSFKGVGIQLNQRVEGGPVEVVTPIDGSPAFKAGVMAGDVILKVNGESIDGVRLPDVIKKITGPLGSEVKLTVHHLTGAEAELKMTREEIVIPVIKGFERKADNNWEFYVSHDPKIAYIRIAQFTSDTADNLRQALLPLIGDGMKGLILDLRFNPGGRLEEAVELIDMFVSKGATIVSTKGRNRPETARTATGTNTLPRFPMIVLVNEHSASASEIVAGSLQDNHRALVIGERTYGKGSVQEVIPLDNKGGELKLTVAYYYLPSGRLVHRKKDATDWGVQPQISVPVDAAAEVKEFEQMNQRDRFLRPTTAPTTEESALASPTTGPTTAAAQASSLDPQLQRALDTMVATLVLQGGGIAAAPTTAPAQPVH